jgi:YegS/Rv2252/BmrU family lipid kinase
MRHFFILNPAAGQGKALRLEKKIWKAADEAGINALVHITTRPGDGEMFVRSKCNEIKDETLRFYACGGDGTLNEVVNGLFIEREDGTFGAASNAEVANIPVGTGNDFIRNYGTADDFRDIPLQITSGSRPCDLISYRGECGGKEISRYSVNMFNIGFDCNVVDKTASLKKKPLLVGPAAYLAGVATMLIKKKGADLTVEYDDGYKFSGKLLLIAVANGCFCGGGVKGIPKARTDDGLMDVSLVKNTTRRNFVRLFPKYSKGTHLEDPAADELVLYKKCRRLKITPNEGKMKLCVDGEITMAGTMNFRIVPEAFRFVVPGE